MQVDAGWWELRPSTKKRAYPIRHAYPHEYLLYLTQLPRFYVIVLFRVAENTWLCLPYNASDAAQRGWEDGTPRVLHLVRHSVQPMDVVVTRDLAGMLLYDSVDTRLESSRHIVLAQATIDIPIKGPKTDGFSNAISIIQDRLKTQAEEEHRRQLEAQRATTEGNIKWHLEYVGAQLADFREYGEGFRVNWTFNGQTHQTTIRRDLRVHSAGICLAGGDRNFNLSSIVHVMEEANDY